MSPDRINHGLEQTEAPYRRYATRYEPIRREACVAWWEQNILANATGEEALTAELDARRHFALLLDISHAGASVALDEIPIEDDRIWLRLEGEDVSEWTEAEVVGMTLTNRGPHLVRLAFRTPCKFEVLRAAVCG